MQPNLMIYGGTFDPPHHGHLNTAKAVQDHMHFEHLVFLPCKIPVLKKAAESTVEQRITMLRLALEHETPFEIDLREITRDTPSFMVETLKSFRQDWGPDAAITLLLGMDAFLDLPRWHEWRTILQLSHLLIIKRTDIDEKKNSAPLKELLQIHETLDKQALKTTPFGKIYRYNAGEYAISSSGLRAQMKASHDIAAYVPKKVYEYIKTEALYQR